MTHQFVDANGIRFAYVEEGTGPLVLLLHGFPDTPQTWDATRPALARAGFRAVSPFLRGYQPTSLAPDDRYGIDDLGADAVALIAALGETSAIVVGHDWGAAAGYSAAALGGPERVRFLVTVGLPHPAGVKFRPRIAWGARHFATLKLPGASRRLVRHDCRGVERLMRRWSPRWDLPPHEADAVKACFSDPAAARAAVRYYHFLSVRPTPSLRLPIQVPTVAFSGTDDPALEHADYERARRCFAGDYRVVDMPGGHFMHREHPDVFVPALLELLAPLRS